MKKFILCIFLMPILFFTIARATTYTVTDTTNSGPGSLRAAIESANNHVGADIIEFNIAFPNTITLNDTLLITDSLTINGPGADSLTIDGGNNFDSTWTTVTITNDFPVFYLSSGTSIINGLTIKNGYIGIIIDTEAIASISNCIITQNYFSYTLSNGNFLAGGGIYNQGSLTMDSCTVSANKGVEGGGAGEVAGGGIFNGLHAYLTMNNCTISGNEGYEGGGIYNYSFNELTMNNCFVSENKVTNQGGGIFNSYSSEITMDNCTISGDSAFEGGGIYNDSNAVLTMSNCTILGNEGEHGGGIYNDTSAVLTMDSCTVSENEGTIGGGIYNGNTAVLTMNNCLVSKNGLNANEGAALNNTYGNASVINCTFLNNQGSLVNSGSIHSSGVGSVLDMTNCTMVDTTDYSAVNYNYTALIHLGNGSLSLINSTIAFAGGVNHAIYMLAGNAFFLNSIFMGNSKIANGTAFNGAGYNVTSVGHNICADNSMLTILIATSDMNDTIPLLDTLAYNGGFTPTCALQDGSPAIDAGTSSSGAPTTDQRGYWRNGVADIGAFEHSGTTTTTATDSVTLTYQLDNGGLYGGSSADLSYSSSTGRLFSGIETPASLFISDDGANTWYPAFDNDSLEFGSKSKGWSGKATRILSNQKGWVAVQCNNPKGKYSSAVISYKNGDTLSWRTAIDPKRLTEWDSTFTFHHISAIALSDYYLVAALGPFIVRIDTGKINLLTDVSNILTTSFNFPAKSIINSIAVSNKSTAYPYYIAVDENGDANGYNCRLIRYNGIVFTELSLPANLNGIRTVFTHPTQTKGDTLFVTGIDINSSEYKIYRSFDSGANWTDVSYPSATTFLSDMDYSPNWNLTASNNAILIIPGNAISKDLGSTWETLGNGHSANAIDPTNLNTIVGSGKAIEKSTTGTSGNFVKTPNDGLEALEVNKLARTESKSVFYIATKTGLGYTTAYLDTNVSAAQKWQSPYGEFPLISDSIHFGAVAIDPTDSMHVIAGSPYGFYVTQTGPTGFSAILPTNFTSNNPQVHDIAILNNTIAIAVTGGDSAYDSGKGKIWRTNDGGLTWADTYSPTGFNSGNTIAIGYGTTDTVLYIGSGLMDADKGYLWKSTDLGITWSKINNGPTSLAGTSILGLPINDIAIDPRGSDTLYIAAGYDTEYASVLSLNGGNSYIYLNNFSGEPFTSITINPANPDTVYMATGREIYLYNFAKNDFRFMFRGLPDEQFSDLMTGSIEAATSTGFYTYHPTWEDDVDTTIITNNAVQLLNGYEVNVFPNPFSNEATINLYVTENSQLQINLYDLTGRKVMAVYNGTCNKGFGNYKIPAANLASGSYLLYVNVNNEGERKLLYHVK